MKIALPKIKKNPLKNPTPIVYALGALAVAAVGYVGYKAITGSKKKPKNNDNQLRICAHIGALMEAYERSQGAKDSQKEAVIAVCNMGAMWPFRWSAMKPADVAALLQTKTMAEFETELARINPPLSPSAKRAAEEIAEDDARNKREWEQGLSKPARA